MFCSEHLTVRGYAIEFKPDKRQAKSKQLLMNINFLNVPPETPDHLLTDYLNNYADVKGTPLYIKKSHDGIEYSTGIRVYQVSRIYQHIPRHQNMFARTIVCIYDIQPEDIQRQQQRQEQRKQSRQHRQQRYEKNYSSTEDSELSQCEEDSEYDWKEVRKPNYRNQRNRQYRDKQYNTYNNITNRKHKEKHTMKNNPPESNERNYPKILTQPINKTNTQQQNPKTDIEKQNKKANHNQQDTQQEITPNPNPQETAEETTIIPETNPLPTTQQDEESFASPAIGTNNRYQILQNTPNPQDVITPETTPKTNESDSDNLTASETTSTKNDSDTSAPTTTKNRPEKQQIQETPQKDRLFQAKKLATKLQATGFRDVRNLNNATDEERTKIIALSMYCTFA